MRWVKVPVGLTSTLAALYRQLNGALALVSGRKLLDLDNFLQPLRLPAAGEHGAQRRTSDGLLISAPPVDLQYIVQAAEGLLMRHPALKIERKNLALSLHYRQAPELEDLCLQVMREAVERSPGVELMQGKCVIDLKPLGFSKGTAIAAFMREAPFVGRTPLFAGDDVTDEAGFDEVLRMGGATIKVGPGPTAAQFRCNSVPQMADWLLSSVSVPAQTRRTAHSA